MDLVFYNRLLRCYVLIDLKIDKLTHQDLGQMYVNYYDRYQNFRMRIRPSEYSLYLPDKKLLQKKLQEWIEEETGGEDKRSCNSSV